MPKTFDQHINKSVPLYKWSHEIGLNVSDFFLPNGTKFYDIGCSTGTFAKKISRETLYKKIQIIGIDQIKEMVKVAKKNCNKFSNIKIKHGDITTAKLNNLKFISSLFNTIHKAI